MMSQIWSGKLSLGAFVVRALSAPLLIVFLVSWTCFGLDNPYHLPLAVIYFWYLMVLIVAVCAVTLLARIISLHANSTLKGIGLVGVALLAVPVFAAPMAQIYAHYLQQEELLTQAIIQAKKPAMPLVPTEEKTDAAEPPEQRGSDYDASIEKYQALKKKRDAAREDKQ